jgi:uncharacterized protein
MKCAKCGLINPPSAQICDCGYHFETKDTEVTSKVIEKISQEQKDERLWAMLCHLSALSGYVIPFGHILGPLIIWLIKKDELPLVDDQGKEAINFHISISIYAIISAILTLLVIGLVMLIAVGIFSIVMSVIAAVQANKGIAYRYPLRIRFLT